jgi:Mlc titration factor MtfA (ptsG expression regulator)
MTVFFAIILFAASTAFFYALANARDEVYGTPFRRPNPMQLRTQALKEVHRLRVPESGWDPDHWHEVLQQHLLFYRNLTDAQQQHFRGLMEAFLYRVQIIAVDFMPVERDYIFIAASAIMPVFHLHNWIYPQLREVIVHPSTFGSFADSEGQHRYTAGLTGTGSRTGVVYLARNVLWEDILQQKPSNVAIHEFIHVLDQADGNIDGLPLTLVPENDVRSWMETMQQTSLTPGDIDPYAFESPAEFLAVTSEYYFTRPDLMQQQHPELYGMLRKMYGG